MNEKPTSIDWQFRDRWVLSSKLGYSIGGVLGWFLIYPIVAFLENVSSYLPISLILVVASILAGAIAGAVIGMAQWWAVQLKASHADMFLWILVNSTGMAICWMIAFRINELGEITDYMFIALSTAASLWGVLTTAIQWHTLREPIHHTPVWFIATTACGMFAFAVGWVWTLIPVEVYGEVNEYTWLIHSILAPIILWPIAGFLYGLMTGSLQARLLGSSYLSAKSYHSLSQAEEDWFNFKD